MVWGGSNGDFVFLTKIVSLRVNGVGDSNKTLFACQKYLFLFSHGAAVYNAIFRFLLRISFPLSIRCGRFQLGLWFIAQSGFPFTTWCKQFQRELGHPINCLCSSWHAVWAIPSGLLLPCQNYLFSQYTVWTIPQWTFIPHRSPNEILAQALADPDGDLFSSSSIVFS